MSCESDGKASVSFTADEEYISSAEAEGKTFVMGINALQYKHLDPSNNW
jgi:hypothetical protein